MNKRQAHIEALKVSWELIESHIDAGICVDYDEDDIGKMEDALEKIVEGLRCRAERLTAHSKATEQAKERLRGEAKP